MPSYTINIYAKFHSNPFTKYRDISSRENNNRRTDRRTMNAAEDHRFGYIWTAWTLWQPEQPEMMFFPAEKMSH